MSISIPEVQLFVLCLTRVLAIFVSIPIFGGSAIPTQYRALFGFVIALVVFPWESTPAMEDAIGIVPFAMMVGQQMIIGIIASFAGSLTFGAIQIAGEMISSNTGFSSARVLNPAFTDSSSAIDQFYAILIILFLMATNGHHLIIYAVSRTFDLIPLNTSFSNIPYDKIFSTFSQMVLTGIQISLPAVGALIMADITLGLLSKVAPQIQVFFLGVPLKIALGLLALTITLSLYHQSMIDLLNRIGDRMLMFLGA